MLAIRQYILAMLLLLPLMGGEAMPSYAVGQPHYIFTMDSFLTLATTATAFETRVKSTIILRSKGGGRYEGEGVLYMQDTILGDTLPCHTQNSAIGKISVSTSFQNGIMEDITLTVQETGTMICSDVNMETSFWRPFFFIMHSDGPQTPELSTAQISQENWIITNTAPFSAERTYQRSKPQNSGETQGTLVEDTRLAIYALGQSLSITDIHAKGLKTLNEKPETGKTVELWADIAETPEWEMLACQWQGDLTAGEGNKDSSCRYQYQPLLGEGPAKESYGEKNVRLTVTAKHILTGATIQTHYNDSYQVYFPKNGDDNADKQPNWFEYWRDNGAIPSWDKADSDIQYDPVRTDVYGEYDPGTDMIVMTKLASESDFMQTVPMSPTCPGFSVPTVYGIDTVQRTIVHEREHKRIEKDRVGQPDYDNDLIPNDVEDRENLDSADPDSCDMVPKKLAGSELEGEGEYFARRAEMGAGTGIARNDWANPGKQAGESSLRAMPLSTANHAALTNELSGRIIGNYIDQGVDANNDGLYDLLRLTVDVNIEEVGDYRLMAWIINGDTELVRSNSVTLSPGTHSLPIDFDGMDIQASGKDGNWLVRLVELSETVGKHGTVQAAQENAHTTTAYSHTSFQPLPVTFNNQFTDNTQLLDAATDQQGDLLIDVGFESTQAGEYTLSGLLKQGETTITTAYVTSQVDTGSQSLGLRFPREAIYYQRIDGPYRVAELRIQDSTGKVIAYQPEGFSTASSYTYAQFGTEGAAFLTESIQEGAANPATDGRFQQLEVALSLETYDNVLYQVMASLEDSEGHLIDSQTVSVVGIVTGDESGTTTATLLFDGSAIALHRVDGPYQVRTAAIFDEQGELMDAQAFLHRTQAYNHTDFYTSEEASFVSYFPAVFR